MKPKTKWLILLLLLICLGLLAFLLASSPTQPAYAGRPLSYWVETYHFAYRTNGPNAIRQEAALAISQIGTNSLPWINQWIHYRPSASRDARRRIFNNLFKNLHIRMRLEDHELDRAYAALQAIELLGPAGKSHIPQLTAILKDTNAVKLRWWATDALTRLGPDALPALMLAVTNGNTFAAIQAMEALGTNARPAIPLLLCALTHTNEAVVSVALAALVRTQPEAAIAVPAMLETLQHPSPAIRTRTAGLLMHFGTNARPAVPLLLRSLQHTNTDLVLKSAECLAAFQFEPQIVVPALARTLREIDPGFKLSVALALARFGTNALSAVPTLLENLGHTNAAVASFSAYTLAKLLLEPPLVVPALTRTLDDPRPEVRRMTARALRDYAGPISESLPLMDSVEPPIRKCLSDPDLEIRQSATNLLLEIKMGRQRMKH